MAKSRKSHGGARPGAGRKATLDGPTKMIVNLEKGQRQKLDKFCARTRKTKSAVVRELIDANVQEEVENGGPSALPGNIGDSEGC